MSLTQQQFLGASISQFSCNIGWNRQTGTLSCVLVEDPDNGDSFDPPIIGAPVYFKYDTFEFGGLLQAWEELNSERGKPLYQVTINDPKEIVEGAQLIIDEYAGETYSVPNLLNVYGYHEDKQFGESRVNEAGMPWNKIRDGVSILTSAVPSIAPQFGGPLRLRGYNFKLDLTELPSAPDYYRIGGTNVGLLDAIEQLCEDAGCDYYVKLVNTSFGHTIKFKVVSRIGQPPLGQIAAFIGDGTNTHGNRRGLELRNDITSAFIVGGNVTRLFVTSSLPSGTNLAAQDQPVWQYWGLDANGIPIIGDDPNVANGQADLQSNDHRFVLNTTMVNIIGVGNFYPCTLGEIRAALMGESSWVSYVVATEPQKAAAVGLVSDIEIVKDTVEAVLAGNGDPREFINTVIQNQQGEVRNRAARLENVRILYQFVASFAREYYGKKFMVRIPFVLTKREDDTERIILSHEPTDGAYVEENDDPLGLPVFFEDLFQTSDGRFQAFVRYNNANTLDLTDLNPSDYVVYRNTLFLKCDVDPTVYFMQTRPRLLNPRVVITLPGIVRKRFETHDVLLPEQEGILLIFEKVKNRKLTANEKERLLETLSNLPAGYVNFGLTPLALMPDFVAVPLKSNILTYGPWYKIGPSGKVHFEKDDTLVPWNYSGFKLLNKAAQAKIQNIVTNMQVGEMGSVTFPGVPSLQIGDVLKLGGPNITGIDVAIDENGVTTTYHMRTYTPKYGAFSRSNADRMSRLIRTAQQIRRSVKELYRLRLQKRYASFAGSQE